MPADPPIAIVGIGCLFPGSRDLVGYWQDVVAGTDRLTEVPQGHSWSPDDHYDADPHTPDKTWGTRGGFLAPSPFDPLHHGLPPAMLESVDSTQLLALLVAREALRDAGLDPDGTGWDRERVSVILGLTGPQELAITVGSRLQGPLWRRALARCGVAPAVAEAVVRDIGNHLPTWTEQTFPGLLANVVAGRIANRLDLGGTNAVVDAACASSLAAVQFAVSELASGRSDLALTGGADTLNDAFMFQCFTRTPALSKRGDARPFDADADGIMLGEGLAVLALKRLADAERDGDRVYAVLRGLGSSSDGRHKSIYAPNPEGQAVALRRAYERAGFGPDTVELVEAHGTGTRAGDAAEVGALTRVFGESGRTGAWAALGSVKAQIGHTKGAAGAAGLVKAALALHQRVLPPAAKVERPNPKMGFDDGPLYLSPRARPWIRAADHPRRAAVSAFGFGGSNFHAVLEQHDAGPTVGRPQAHLVLIGGDTAGAVERQLAALVAASDPDAAVRDVLSAWRPGADHVAAAVAGGEALRDQVGRAIARLRGGDPLPGDAVWIGGGEPAPCAWVFPGQGSQYVELGRTLALRWAPVRDTFDLADEGFRQAGLPPLSSRTFPPPAWSEGQAHAQAEALRATEWAQPAIGALSIGMAAVLQRFGLRPDVVAGHSYGELVALHVAGVFDAATTLLLSRERGRCMSATDRDRGAMLAVDGPLDTIARVVAREPGVGLANRNHPEQGVVSGDRAALDRVGAELVALGLRVRPLPVAAAFHSPLVADAREPFLAAVQATTRRAPTIDVLSCVDGRPYPADPDAIASRLADQLVAPVDWVGVVDALWDRGVRTFVEVGPRGVLAGLIERCLGDRRAVVTALDRAADRDDGDTQLKRALAALAAAGLPVDPAPLLAERWPAPAPEPGVGAVWIAGANYRNPETTDPPMPPLPEPPRPAPDADGWGAVPSTGRPMAPPQHWSAAAAPVPASAPAATSPASSDLAALLDTTRATLAAFQDAQARTAEVHGKFLDAVARANDNFARLFEAHTRLVEQVAGTAPSVPVAVALPAPPAPPMAPPAPSWASPAETAAAGRVAVPTFDKPAVANDLPPIFDVQAALDARRAASTASAGTTGPASTAPTARDLERVVLDAVAAKTGYPRAALQPTMELERDLGVDSIKRVEILTATREALPSLPELDQERLSGLRRLSDVVDALLGGPTSPVASLPPPAPPKPVPQLGVPVRLRRRPVDVVQAPPRRPIPASDRAGRWVVTADPGATLATALVAALRARGVDAVSVEADAFPGPAGLGGGVVHLAAVGASGEDQARRIRAGFAVARSAGPCARFVTVSDGGGRFGRGGGAGSPSVALAGLAKTVAREWTDCRALALDLGPEPDVEAIADELLGERDTIEVGLAEGAAWTLADAPAPALPADLPLGAGDLVVVTGGGRGVTAAAIVALAERVPVAVLLLGRTAASSSASDEPAWALGVADGDLVGARLAAGGGTPREAEMEAGTVRAAREIRATLAALTRAGAQATYVAVDGRDAGAVRDAVAAAEALHGPTRALIHGAGVLADRRIVDKDDEGFDRVWSTKVGAFDVLLGAVDPAGLRLCCVFASVAGRYGNAGQVDYAMANEALVQRLLELRARAPGVRIKAIDWGPWDGGMVTPTLRARFEAQGQAVIPVQAGARAFVDELAQDAVEVVIEAPLPRSGVVVRRLDPTVAWLADHRIAGRPVVPAAMVVEWLASLGAEIAPGAKVAVRDLEVLKGIVLDGSSPPELTLVWGPGPVSPAPSLGPTPDRVVVELLGSLAGAEDGPLGPPRLYRGTIEFDGPAPLTSPPSLDGLCDEPFPATRAEIYGGQLFHGPAYQALDELVGIGDAGAVAWIRTSRPADLGVAGPRWHTDPVVIDAAFQLGVLWVQHRLGSGVLPSTVRSVRWAGPLRGSRVQCRLRVGDDVTAQGGTFSVALLDEDERVVATIDGRYVGDRSTLPLIRAAG